MLVLMVVVLMVDDLRKLVNDLVEDAEQAPECECIKHDISRYLQISSVLLLSLRLVKLIQSVLAVFMCALAWQELFD